MLIRHSMLALAAASLAIAAGGTPEPAREFKQPPERTPDDRRREREALSERAAPRGLHDRSKYMPHMGAKQRAKGLARLAKEQAKAARLTPPAQ